MTCHKLFEFPSMVEPDLDTRASAPKPDVGSGQVAEKFPQFWPIKKLIQIVRRPCHRALVLWKEACHLATRKRHLRCKTTAALSTKPDGSFARPHALRATRRTRSLASRSVARHGSTREVASCYPASARIETSAFLASGSMRQDHSWNMSHVQPHILTSTAK